MTVLVVAGRSAGGALGIDGIGLASCAAPNFGVARKAARIRTYPQTLISIPNSSL
jgi:hypothetical protein